MISWIIGSAYAVYLLSYFGVAIGGSADTAEAVGASIAALVTPHIICVCLAVIFNILSWATNIRWAALCGGILYSVALVLFLPYFLFVVAEIVLSFSGFTKMKKNPTPASSQNTFAQ